MSLQLEESNGDNGFELVDRPKDTEPATLSSAPLFMTSGVPLNLPQPIILPVSSTQFQTVPVVSATSPPTLSTLSNIQPMAPPAPLFFPAASSSVESLVKPATFELPIIENPLPVSLPERSSLSDEALKPTGGIFGWMTGLPGKGILSKVAEKARSSVDTLVTTLDPQMKEFLYSGGDIDIVVASAKESKVSAVREAFQAVFGKATVRGCDSQSSSTAAQPVGFSAAFQAAEDRIFQLRASGQVHPQSPIVALEGFVVELYGNNWFDMCCLLLDDPARNVKLHSFTQPLALDPGVVLRMQNATPAEYPLRQSGFALTVGQAVEQEFQVPASEWQLSLTGLSRRELILMAGKSLAFAYKKIPGLQI